LFPSHDLGRHASENPVIDDALKRINKDSAYKLELKNVEPNTIGHLDLVKKVLGDMEEQKGSSSASAAPFAKTIIANQRRNLVDAMDDVAPTYKEARALSERKKARENISKVFDKKEISAPNFYKAIQSDKEYNNLLFHLRNVEPSEVEGEPSGGQKKLMAMKLLFNDLAPVPSVRTAAHLARTGMLDNRSSTKDYKRIFEDMFSNGKVDAERINAITDPNWQKAAKIRFLEKANKSKKIKQLSDALGKISAQTTAKEVSN
jgi:hypothetical protein